MRKDIVYAVRNMAANPGVFIAAVLTLALGIGANTAMFSVIHAVLLRPLPFREPDRLVTLFAQIPHLNISGAFVEYNTFGEWWRDRSRSFDSMAAYTPESATLTAGDQPQRVLMYRVSATYLSVIGTTPVIGRDFLPEEDRPGAPRVAILSDGLWKRRFGGDRGLLGRPILLNKNAYTIVGILSPDFDLDPADVLTPIAQSTARAPDMPSVGTYARLKRGVSLEKAQAEIDALCRGWVQQYHYPRDWGARVWRMHDHMVRDVRSSIVVLAVAVCLVLLIACANVANLLLARAGARQREIAIRSALGAGRKRIVRQLLTESAVLGTVASGFGLLLAWAATRAIIAADVPVPFSRKVSVDLPVLYFTIAATLLTTVLFGLAPALAAAHSGLAEYLKEGGRGAGEGVRRNRFRAALVVAEVALALLLVIGATLTIRSLARLQAVNLGFNPEGVLTAALSLPESGYAEPSRRVNFYKILLERIQAVPGVNAAGTASDLPFSGSKSGNDIVVEGAPPPQSGDRMIAFVRTVDPGYFSTMQARLLHGRFFTPRDSSGPPVAIINDTLARRCWPNQDPVGKRFGSGGRQTSWLTVIGVIGDMRNTSLADEPDLEYYVPYAMHPAAGMSLAVRTALDPLRLASALRGAVRELDKDLPVSDVSTLANSISHSTSSRRFSTTLFGVFALLALVLASVGIYGVISYSVTRRTQEIGVRIALGAAPGRIAAIVVSRALLLGALGVGIGIAGSLALTRLLRSMLYGVSATDPVTFTAASLFLLAVSGVAAYLPARRAAGVDPTVALHHE
ncbi:MAG TPA: ABC transporter permease [Bryobacteraceae bacterium]|nr:ABC transporter permease [Bryobacteraceae bacterium]